MEWTGGCLCGAVRYRTEAELLWIGHCHCGNCRKATGAVLGTYVGFPAGSVEWTKDKPTLYRSSPEVERGFCPRCGGTLSFHRVHETSIAVGSLDQPEDLEVGQPRSIYYDCHVWTERQLPWLHIEDDLPRFERWPAARTAELAALAGGHADKRE